MPYEHETEQTHISLLLCREGIRVLQGRYSYHLPDTELYQEDDAHWILDTVVHGLGPLRWFYVMLADKIEILDSPAADALKEEVRKFVEKHLQ